MPRRRDAIPPDISSNSKLYVETLDLLKELFQTIFHAGCVKILLCLVRAYQSNYGLTYTQLSELTGLKKRQFDYPLNSLRRHGLIRVTAVKEPSAMTIYEPTDAGIIIARGLIRSIIMFIEPLAKDKKLDKYPMIAEAYEAFKQLEVRFKNEGFELTPESVAPILSVE
jgi:DNA-binding transcriptional ArsR family regulator